MNLDPLIEQTIDELYELHKDLAQGEDNQRRILTKMVIEQVIFDFPNDKYGWKSSSPTNPPSKDSMARQTEQGLISWDLFDGASREPNTPKHNRKANSEDITGQNFIPLGPVNHLNHKPPDVIIPGDDKDDDINLVKILEQIVDNQEAGLSLLGAMINATSKLEEAIKKLQSDGVKVRF